MVIVCRRWWPWSSATSAAIHHRTTTKGSTTAVPCRGRSLMGEAGGRLALSALCRGCWHPHRSADIARSLGLPASRVLSSFCSGDCLSAPVTASHSSEVPVITLYRTVQALFVRHAYCCLYCEVCVCVCRSWTCCTRYQLCCSAAHVM
jgi:hypothetical protein